MATPNISAIDTKRFTSFCRGQISELLNQLSPQSLIGEAPSGTWSRLTGKPPYILSVGKAARQMSETLAHLFSVPISQTLTIIPEGYPPPDNLPYLMGNHPFPGTKSQTAAIQALSFVGAIPEQERLLCAISGGASSLLFQPATGLSAKAKSDMISNLMLKGAPIEILNHARVHLSAIKGGGLLKGFRGREVHTVLLSDTPCLPPETVGSGLTFPLKRDGGKTISILQEWLFPQEIPEDIRQFLISCQNHPPVISWKSNTILLGNSETVLKKAAHLLTPEGVQPELLTACLSGEAQEAGKVLGSIIRWHAQDKTRARLFLATGETTVTLSGEAGHGGRTLELGLSLGLSLKGIHCVIGCLATDGVDGNSGLSGILLDTFAIQNESTRTRIRKALRMHDTASFVQEEGFSLQFGPSGTNLNDLLWIYLPPQNQ
ncbi:MAG: DUF4147 domain-containing protein [Leptospirales bacterium]